MQTLRGYDFKIPIAVPTAIVSVNPMPNTARFGYVDIAFRSFALF
jgi:hypothetical protein